MTETPDELLTSTERDGIERALEAFRGSDCSKFSVEAVWNRRHLLRIESDEGSVIVKRPKVFSDGSIGHSMLRNEAVALTMCAPMPDAVAPRMIGFDRASELLFMEDLPPGRALADLLLLGGRDEALEGVRTIARSLARLHTWTSTRESLHAEVTRDLLMSPSWRSWQEHVVDSRAAFVLAVEGTRADTAGLDEEIDRAQAILAGSSQRGLVHSDLCPDNLRVTDGGARIFDFEVSTFGPCALDVAFFLAPFPSCWCFAELPVAASEEALAAYEREMRDGGAQLGDGWQESLAAALVSFIVYRAASLSAADENDDEWGTTSMRPRLVTWLESFAAFPASSSTFPRLAEAARQMVEVLRDRWTDLERPIYPAFRTPGDDAISVPDFWDSAL